ncbi:hypothetical protein QFC22_003374 [Naganishia vaughanmartiniae]|uniref:Uncharacterized protein n=1 Tax=Naganishia vaughanmartiniae TaxID=1424756 RepID=A0ACC2X6I0_9TREE|nr:hypothetical protein QFC22_003374 [Naganishia vaughanmartiniae]
MSEPSSPEYEKYLIVPEITIVPTAPDEPAVPPAAPAAAGPADNDNDGNSGDDRRPPKPETEIIKVPRAGGVGEITLCVSEVEDGWLLLDYVEEPLEEVKKSDDLVVPPAVSDHLKNNATDVVAS